MLNLKKKTKERKYILPSRAFTVVGLVWIAVSTLIFLQAEDRSSDIFKLCLQISMFYIGGLSISYGIVRETKDSKNTADQIVRIFLFAIGVSLASLVVYGWLSLFVHGF